MGRKFGFSFSWKRALGISSAKSKLARMTGIPTTRQGRQRKYGSAAGCCLMPTMAMMMVILIACGSTVEIQDEVDQSFVRTQVAATLFAKYQATATPIPTPTLVPVPVMGTRSSPVAIGNYLELVKDDGTYFRITILEAIRGEAAFQMIMNANQFNEQPLEGMEYIISKVAVECLSSKIPDQLLEITAWDFSSMTNNQVFDVPFVVLSDEELNVKLFPGGRGEGYIPTIAFINDPTPLIVYDPLFGSDMFYFAIQ